MHAHMHTVLEPAEDPWLNELLGSRRAEARGLRVGLIVAEWYEAVSSGGVLNAKGRQMELKAARRSSAWQRQAT